MEIIAHRVVYWYHDHSVAHLAHLMKFSYYSLFRSSSICSCLPYRQDTVIYWYTFIKIIAQYYKLLCRQIEIWTPAEPSYCNVVFYQFSFRPVCFLSGFACFSLFIFTILLCDSSNEAGICHKQDLTDTNSSYVTGQHMLVALIILTIATKTETIVFLHLCGFTLNRTAEAGTPAFSTDRD